MSESHEIPETVPSPTSDGPEKNGVDSQAEEPEKVYYMGRVIRWSDKCQETGNQAHARLVRDGYFEAWRQATKHMVADAKRKNKKDGSPLIPWHIADFETLKNFPPDLPKLVDWGQPENSAAPSKVHPADEAFVFHCRAGLRMRLPEKASAEDEITWVATNMHRDEPRLHNVPSYSAINWVITARLDPAVSRSFWSTYQTRRMTPGDKKAATKAKGRTFGETDVEQDTSQDEVEHGELMRRMFEGVVEDA